MKIVLKDRRNTVPCQEGKSLEFRPLDNGKVTVALVSKGVYEVEVMDLDALELLMAARFCHQRAKQLAKISKEGRGY